MQFGLYFTIVEGLRKSQLFWLLLPLAVCVLVMLPRLVSPQFGFLDDGVTLTTSSRIVSGDLSLNYESERGRFRPMYWLAPVLVYGLAGARPFWFFFANLVVLVLIVVFFTAFLRQLGVSPPKAALMGILFILTGSVMENTYTLSKGELLQLLFITAALYNSARLKADGVTRRSMILRTLLSAALLFLANMNKETGLVILPLAAAWLLSEYFIARLARRKPSWHWLASLFISALISFTLYWLLRYIVIATTLQTGIYATRYSFTIAAMKASFIRWTGWLLRDELYLLPLVLFWIIASLVSKKARKVDFLLPLLIWLAGWIAIYLPWWFAQEYYLLPFDLGASVLCILLVSQAWRALRAPPRVMPVIAGAAMALSALLWLVSMPNHLTDARIQLAVDSANQQILDALEKLPAGSSLLLNIQDPNEYTVELDLLLRHVHGRSDISLGTFNPAAPQPADFILTPIIQNEPLLTVRMGVIEASLDAWRASMQAYLGADVQPSLRVERNLPLRVVDLPRLFCPFISTLNFCAAPRPIIDTRTFMYGWALYPVNP
jgi:hypothetical protein